MQSKTALRAQVQSALRSLAAEDILGQSTAVAEQLFGCEPVARCLRQPGGLVCSYLPMRRELSPDAITQQLLAAGQGVMVPRVTGGASADMVMLPVSSWADVAAFPKNQWGIPEPPLPAAGGSEPLATDLLAQVKLVLVPGLAFDSGCARLGRGKGYYDAFFERLRACCPAMPLLVGLSLSEQCVASVPTEAHDVLLDAVVTPTGVLFGPGVAASGDSELS